MTDRFSLLCLKDPLNNGVDLGRNSFGFMEVRKAFHYAYQVLTQAVVPHIDQESNGHSILGRIIRVTDEVMDHRLWVQQNWAGKQWLYAFVSDTALRIAQPIRPVNATTIILADSSQRNSQETGSCQEVNKKSAMNPTAATNMSNSNDVINNKSRLYLLLPLVKLCLVPVILNQKCLHKLLVLPRTPSTLSKDPLKGRLSLVLNLKLVLTKPGHRKLRNQSPMGRRITNNQNSANGAIILLTLFVVSRELARSRPPRSGK
ncbi:putative non-canonical poly(A) RNA polymerase PAPD5 [Apostichopus japonicus]|uniref:Putative non-canonical poly(A) RNA polymerase PAPD5 n=1 Tax=Stichopus japonicus TaxID=307972 RepID=A0A2G8L859_STIJA|nr:putative non-canonical poly(A) RNA polymerase PAPD5 [Apostichopus japonicus]